DGRPEERCGAAAPAAARDRRGGPVGEPVGRACGEGLWGGLVERAFCRYLIAAPQALIWRTPLRRGGRAVECTALEMRHTRKGIGASNPSLSAIPHSELTRPFWSHRVQA